MSKPLISAEKIAELQGKFGDRVAYKDLRALDRDLAHAARDGGLQKLARGVFSLVAGVESKLSHALSEEDEAAEIDSRFEALEILADAVIAGNIRSLIVSGAAGVGKSFTLENKLADAMDNSALDNVTHIKGTISAIGLYMMLWENKGKDDVTVFDDIDSIYGDDEALNLLKGALDTNGRRVISWIKDSRFLADKDNSNEFEFKGRVVFLTNVDLQREADKGGKMSPHMLALMSRAVYLDLGIHTAQQVMIRIRQVLKKSDMGMGISAGQTQQIVDWMQNNVLRLRSISLRTVLQVAGFMKTSPDWQVLARATLLRNR